MHEKMWNENFNFMHENEILPKYSMHEIVYSPTIYKHFGGEKLMP